MKKIFRNEDKKFFVKKLPKNAYKLSFIKFQKLINDYPLEVKKVFLKRYRSVSASLKAQEEIKERNKEKHIKGNPHYTLTEEQRRMAVELSGRFYSNKQIMKIINEDWGTKYSVPSLSLLLKRNRETITQRRQKYASSTDNLRYVHERARIEELSDIVEKAKNDSEYKILIEALKEIRNEVKGDKLTLDNNIRGEININVRQQMLSELDIEMFGKMAIMKLLEKHGIDFQKMAHRMTTVLIEKDPNTNEVINKRVPIEVKGVGLLKEKEVKEINNIEEAKWIANPVNVKKLLKKRLLAKMNEMKNSEDKIYDIEEKSKPSNKPKSFNKKDDDDED